MAKKADRSDNINQTYNTTNVIAGNTTNNYYIYIIVVFVVVVIIGAGYATGIFNNEPQPHEHVVKAGEGRG